jgi:hypothetical protein
MLMMLMMMTIMTMMSRRQPNVIHLLYIFGEKDRKRKMSISFTPLPHHPNAIHLEKVEKETE